MGVLYRLTGNRRMFVTSKAIVEMNRRTYTSGWQSTIWERTETRSILEFSPDGNVQPAPFWMVHFPWDYDVPRPSSLSVPVPLVFQMDFWIHAPEPMLIEEVIVEDLPPSNPSPMENVLDVFTSYQVVKMGSPPDDLIDLNDDARTPPTEEMVPDGAEKQSTAIITDNAGANDA